MINITNPDEKETMIDTNITRPSVPTERRGHAAALTPDPGGHHAQGTVTRPPQLNGHVPASDSPSTLPVIEADLSNGRCGFDFFGLSFPVEKPDAEPWEEHRHRAAWSRSYRVALLKRLPLGKGILTLTSGRVPGTTNDYWGAAEVVPSHVVDGTKARLCSFDDWPDVLDAVIDAIGEWLAPKVQADAFKVRRLDVARDLDEVDAYSPYAYAALARTMPFATRKNLITNGATRPQTAEIGTETAGHVAFYDRHQLHPDVVPPGRVRFEARGHTGWLSRRAGIATLKDLTVPAALAFLEDRWEAFGGGVPIVGEDQLLATTRALTHDDGTPWSTEKQERFLGHMFKLARGVAEPLPSSRKAAYRKAITRTGITLTGGLTGIALAPESTRSLDLFTGTEVRSPNPTPIPGEGDPTSLGSRRAA